MVTQQKPQMARSMPKDMKFLAMASLLLVMSAKIPQYEGCSLHQTFYKNVGSIKVVRYHALNGTYRDPLTANVSLDSLLNDKNFLNLNLGLVRMSGGNVRFNVTGDPCYNDFTSSLCKQSNAQRCAMEHLYSDTSNALSDRVDMSNMLQSLESLVNSKPQASLPGQIDSNAFRSGFGIRTLYRLGMLQAVRCTANCTGTGLFTAYSSLLLLCFRQPSSFYFGFENCGNDSTALELYSRKLALDQVHIEMNYTGFTNEQLNWILTSFNVGSGMPCKPSTRVTSSSYVEMSAASFRATVKIARLRLRKYASGRYRRSVLMVCHGVGVVYVASICDVTQIWDRLGAISVLQTQISLLTQVATNQATQITGLTNLAAQTTTVVAGVGNLLLQTRLWVDNLQGDFIALRGYVWSDRGRINEMAAVNVAVVDDITEIQKWILSDELKTQGDNIPYEEKLSSYYSIDNTTIDFVETEVGDVVLSCASRYGATDRGLVTVDVGGPEPSSVRNGILVFKGEYIVRCKPALVGYSVVDPLLTYMAPCKVEHMNGSSNTATINGWFDYELNVNRSTFTILTTSEVASIRANNPSYTISVQPNGGRQVCRNGTCILTTDSGLQSSISDLQRQTDSTVATNNELTRVNEQLLQQVRDLSRLNSSPGVAAVTTYGGATLTGLIFSVIGAAIAILSFIKDKILTKGFKDRVLDVISSNKVERFENANLDKIK